jgi:dipeptidyl aminopeptidase/acylaminoacyl peptidase
MGIRIFLLLLFICFYLSTMVSAEAQIMATFIRDHQLWLKKGNQEIQLTKDQYVHSPKWSFDGRFIAYIDGDEQGEKSNLFIYDIKEKESYQPYVTVETANLKWSPIKNQLAYTNQGLLNITGTLKSGTGPHPVGRKLDEEETINSFPFGNHSKSLTPKETFSNPDANLNGDKMKPFFTVQTNTADL